MPWKRLKMILIITSVLVNGFMTYLVWNMNQVMSDYMVSQSTIQAALSQLDENTQSNKAIIMQLVRKAK
jgi:regulatory protein YycI of two-component signal transduction system YycFG